MNEGAYAAARERAALARRADRTFLSLEGRDPGAMLQGIVSNDVRPVAAGSGAAVYAVLLTPKGKMIADVRVLPGPSGAYLLDVPAAAQAGVLAHFARVVPPRMAKASPADLHLLGVYGPDGARALADALHSAPPDGARDALVRVGELLLVGTDFAGGPGIDVTGPPEAVEELALALQAAGMPVLDAAALEVLRVEAGTPAWGAELDADRIPIEAGLAERAISQTKGCYTGQEVIIRILHRGHVNWHLRGLVATEPGVGTDHGATPRPAPGDELRPREEPRVAARVTSAVESPRLGPIALAYVRREVDVGEELVLPADPGGGDPAAMRVVELPFPAPAPR